MPVKKSTQPLRRILVFSWGTAFALAVFTIFIYRNFSVNGLLRLQSDDVQAYALSILNVFCGPLLSIVFFNFDPKFHAAAALSREHALLCLCTTFGAIFLTLFQFYSPLVVGLGTTETIAGRIAEVDAFLSIINTAFVLPLNLLALASTHYAAD